MCISIYGVVIKVVHLFAFNGYWCLKAYINVHVIAVHADMHFFI